MSIGIGGNEGERLHQAETGEKCRRWIILTKERPNGEEGGCEILSARVPMSVEFSTTCDYQECLDVMDEVLISQADDFMEFETEAEANEWFKNRTGKHPDECSDCTRFHPEIGDDDDDDGDDDSHTEIGGDR